MKNPVSPDVRTTARDLDGRLGPAILCLGRVFERRLTRALAQAGLGVTPAQARIVMKLHIQGPLSQQELASRIDVEPSTLVGTLDVMEREGLATRESNPDDRRAHLVRLTETGGALVPRLLGLIDLVEAEIEDVFPGRERARLQESLERLIERLSMGEET
ncbi:MAG TPA: MarR family transcriptional regulator [Gemmatimonadota bacterium]|jgi:DNA-binding MarR family transcriptional regulator|nr:MarR family transcriptional regulator [Gemmatimonadota bacterium]